MFVANVRVITAPTEEPISVNEAKDHLRVDSNSEDGLIDRLVVVARRECERVSRRAFVSRTLDAQLDAWPRDRCIELPYPPLASVTSITYIDSDGGMGTLAASEYVVDAHSQPGRITLGYSKSWPSATLRPGGAITVRYVAGYGGAEDVPEEYKQAIYLLLGHYYENREAVIVQQGVTALALPLAVEAILLGDRGSY